MTERIQRIHGSGLTGTGTVFQKTITLMRMDIV